MNWNWKDSFKQNFYKIFLHEIIEIAWLGSWVIGLNGSWEGWVIGITGSVLIHMFVFHGIDVLHEHHHHHNKDQYGHKDHKN